MTLLLVLLAFGFSFLVACVAVTCRHPRTVYNEQDETLYCLQCESWVLPDDRVPLGREGG